MPTDPADKPPATLLRYSYATTPYFSLQSAIGGLDQQPYAIHSRNGAVGWRMVYSPRAAGI
eukprot:614695-Rhodomonas_salina.1